MRTKAIGVTLFLLFNFSIHADEANPKAVDGKLKSLMHFFHGKLVQVKPYLVSEESFKSPEAQKAVKSMLEEMTQRAQSLPPETIEQTPGFRITYRLIGDHLERTKKALEHGELDYARLRLNATSNFCINCHSQVPERKSGLFSFSSAEKDLSEPTFENAEFLFILRRFDQAIEKYDQMIRTFPKSKLKADQFPQVYRRKLAIFSRVKRNPDDAIKNLREDLKNKQIPVDVQQNVISWIQFFENWKSEKTDPAKLSDEMLIQYVEKNVPEEITRQISPADPESVQYLRLSGLLYERLLKNPDSPQVPQMLYALALCEKHISPIYWYPMSEIYLKECIEKYPKKPITKKCYQAYEKAMQNRYLMKGPVPEHIKSTLNALKNYL